MEGLSPQERLILAAIEVELRDNAGRLAGRIEEFNAKAAQEGPQRFAAHVSHWEVAAVLAMVVLMSAILTLVALTCG
jgi:hypothetical protein